MCSLFKYISLGWFGSTIDLVTVGFIGFTHFQALYKILTPRISTWSLYETSQKIITCRG